MIDYSRDKPITLALTAVTQVIKDYKLFLVVAVLVSIDVAILTTWQVLRG